MVSLSSLYILNIIIFGVIGAMRGWAKEILITFSVVLGLFIITILENYLPIISPFLTQNRTILFWVRIFIIITLLLFGYSTPNIPALQKKKAKSDEDNQVPDALLGIFLGLLNGYLIYGTIWFFLDQANYPFSNLISAPSLDNPFTNFSASLVETLPPQWLRPPLLFIILALFAVFIMIAFI